ncbi:MAG: dTMP kinase [Thiotrichaceae bacterium]|nr:dTMP kinase [Thiotrichaceae bacterium]
MTKRGLFITIEGVEGAGKSCNMPFIRECLEQTLSVSVVPTREPGGTEVSEAIRGVLISNDLPAMSHDAELLLMFAARAEHLDKLIIPALEQGSCVLCDRFTDASYAYQGGGRGLSLDRIATMERFVQGDLRPDYTILFDVEAEIGLARAKGRGEADRFEHEAIDFFNRVRQQYLKMAVEQSQRYRIIDASVGFDEVQQQLRDVIGGLQ